MTEVYLGHLLKYEPEAPEVLHNAAEVEKLAQYEPETPAAVAQTQHNQLPAVSPTRGCD